MTPNAHPADVAALLLPRPRVTRLSDQRHRVDVVGLRRVDPADARLIAACARLGGATRLGAGCEAAQSPGARGADATALSLDVDRGAAPAAGGYRLLVTVERIAITGADPAGCFYGLQTLGQLLQLGGGCVPIGEIHDWPDLATRGVLLDVSRGRVPTVDALKERIDRLAQLKVNQVQLYIEHTFAFAFDPDISMCGDALTADEIRELDAFCRDRFIDLVPALAAPGHMGRILSMPRYRQLAEIEPAREWADMTWLQRLRGATIDVMNPESMRLVTRMWDELLDAFSSPVVNICGDEPHDLGRGRNRECIGEGGIAGAYRDWIRGVTEHCQRRGRRVQAWSDVIVKHPEIWPELLEHGAQLGMNATPADSRGPKPAARLTVLHWGYDDQTDYAATQRFIDSGAATIVCPGVVGWKRILNAMDAAERNIATFAVWAGKCGAAGMLNTDWGDYGHFNSPACSWHGLALGAALAWRTDHETGNSFDRRLAWWMFGLDDSRLPANAPPGGRQPGDVFGPLRQASRVAEACETWRSLASLGTDEPYPEVPPTADRLEETIAAANAAEKTITQLVTEPRASARADVPPSRRSAGEHDARIATMLDAEELRLACSFTRLWAKRMLDLRRNGSASRRASADCIDAFHEAGDRYRQAWLARYKPMGLADIESCLDAIVDSPGCSPRMQAVNP